MLVVLMVFSIVSVFLLYAWMKAGSTRQYDFQRNITGGVVHPDTVVSLHTAGWYIAGNNDKQIWLAHPRLPHALVAISDDDMDTLVITGLADSVRATEITTDAFHFYVTDMERFDVYCGVLSTMTVHEKITDHTFFAEAVPLGNQSLVLRTVSSNNIYRLEKKSDRSLHSTAADDLLQQQIDGLFCTDGKLHYDRTRHQLVYLYFYRNEFIVADTNLHLLYRAHTIDPVDTAQIRVAEIKSENAIRLSRPPLVVNAQSVVADGLLLVNSALASKHEDPVVFSKVSVMDVYDLDQRGIYRFSFYIPDYRGHPVSRFVISGNKLTAVHGTYLVRYTLTSNLIISDP